MAAAAADEAGCVINLGAWSNVWTQLAFSMSNLL